MNRRKFIKNSSAGLALASLPAWLTACSFTEERPNIIFIMSDDHATQAISAYGSKINKTPNIDRLAKEGMIFKNCFCTNSICSPSRAAILTGKFSHKNGVMDNKQSFDGSQMTYPKLLRENGYQTAMIGKWHLKSEPTGFDYYSILPGQGDYFDPEFIEMGETNKHKGYVTDLITDKSIEWLKNRDKEKPFLLISQHKAPHRKWFPDEKHAKLYENETISEPETFNDDYSTRSDAARLQEMTIAKHLTVADVKKPYPDGLSGQSLKEWKYQRYIKDYLRCVASLDDNVGRLINYLDETGLRENTIIIYTSDQGFFLGEHGWFDKRFMYEESLRMPFIVSYPGIIEKGSENENLVQNIDFAETLLDFANIEIPASMQGKSLRKLLTGKNPDDWRDAVYYHYYAFPASHSVRKHYGIRTKRYKLIHFYEDLDQWELFDLDNDPNELNNLYNDKSYANVISVLKTQLADLQKQYEVDKY
ncbi:MAG: sulfatase [Candidatus Cloacimonetes bacterium]|nr:sulfatase [Candidatus Cloacimonadota bacterium]